MKATLEPTGERLVEAAYVTDRSSYAIYVTHAASYGFANRFIAGKKVLDLGCGSGYGVARLAEIAASVVGVDIAPDAIAFAREAYARPNTQYQLIEAGSTLPFGDSQFDVVISFQVIEHVGDDDAYLREARRVLVPGGILILITPDRRFRLFPSQRPWNRWHVREYSQDDLRDRVARCFTVLESLRMGARWDIAGLEIRRYRWTRLLTLPFTLPGTPERWRRAGLDFLHSLRPRRAPVAADGARNPEVDFGFGESDISVSADEPHSLNLVIIARKPDR